jgi:fumarate reductase subunit D
MARSSEPLWWGPFSAGMMVGALFVPALIVITGLLIPLGVIRDAEHFRALVNYPLTRLLLFVVISLSLFHWAHRFRYVLFDLGVTCCSGAIAFFCYGSAVAGTVLAALIALHML